MYKTLLICLTCWAHISAMHQSDETVTASSSHSPNGSNVLHNPHLHAQAQQFLSSTINTHHQENIFTAQLLQAINNNNPERAQSLYNELSQLHQWNLESWCKLQEEFASAQASYISYLQNNTQTSTSGSKIDTREPRAISQPAMNTSAEGEPPRSRSFSWSDARRMFRRSTGSK